jgi:MFS family permease
MSDLETKNAIRMILLTASLGGMSYLSFNNGILLSYFSHLGIPSATILILLSILPLTTFLVIIPFSYFSDIFGKKRIGIIGMVFSFFGFALLIGVSYLPDSLRIMAVGFGIVVFGIGSAMTLGNWFALLHPIIPENIRGRFFGQLRLTWQSIGILFTLIVIYILELYPTLGMYQAILGIITILMLLRMFFYQQKSYMV